MKKSDVRYFRIGLFIILAMVLLAAGLVTFGLGQFFKKKIILETYVDGTVQGIEVGSAVKFRGVTIGKVSEVGFVFTMYPQADRSGVTNYVVLIMQIDKEIFPGMFQTADLTPMLDRGIERGLRVQIEPQGITGMNYLEINYLEPARFKPIEITWKPHHYYLPSAPGELTNLLDSVNNIMREVEKLNIQGISDGTVALLDNLNHAITGAQIEELSTGAQALFKRISTAIDEVKIEELGADTRKLLAEIRQSNDELKTILSNIEPASQLNADDVAATLSNLRTISDNLRSVSGEIVRDPSSLIFSRPPKPSNVVAPPQKRNR